MFSGIAALIVSLSLASHQQRAVVAYPAADHNGAFSAAIQQEFVDRLSSHYALRVVRDISTEDDLYALSLHGEKLLVIGGHGTKTSLAFGAPEDPCIENCDEKYYLDLSDEKELRNYFSGLAPDATIFLYSCSNAAGDIDGTFAGMVKRAAGKRKVIAGKTPFSALGITINSYDPFDVTIRYTMLAAYGFQMAFDVTSRQ